ncbi:hypothetical protein BKE38_24855 [Pseudoroseomonas deserti]|uniref:Spore coat protein U domain-containing protein n=1 Tax=Teichococcus deserti TaxID=1817963 RepID=A0A1V2GVF0_9PROT|nr:hypothetical protein [Pseudoroseomonas deserti]ONG46846.1 hypothetical protein BKE38_24855 [Pseudoroseomonas deserti]
MRRRTAPLLAATALLALGAGAAEAQRVTTAFAVGAVVPSPSCIASVASRELLAVRCSGPVSFVAQATSLSAHDSAAPGMPSLSVSLLSEAGPAVLQGTAPHPAFAEGVLITVIY